MPATYPSPHRWRPRRRAFTLLELIVVVIILSVLAAVATIGYSRYVDHARSTALHATAVQVDKAITARSARDDATPGDVVATSIAAGGIAAYLKVTGDDYTYAADDATAPTTVTVSIGDRAECLTLGTQPGQSAKISPGPCAEEPTQPPAQVSAPSGSAGDGTATVAFTETTDAITYRGTCTSGTGDTATGTAAASPVTVTGLSNGTSYQCTVAAGNTVGWSPESDPVTVTPAAPANFVAVANAGTVSTSADGSTWSAPATVNAVGSARAVEFAGDRWFLLGSTGTLATSTDAKTWTSRSTPATTPLLDIEGNATTGWMAVGNSGAIVYSGDGATWTQVTGYPGGTTSLSDVEYFNGRWYVTGRSYGSAYYTSDRTTWTKLSVNGNSLGTFSYAVADGHLYAIPGNGSTYETGKLYRSATGDSGAGWDYVAQIRSNSSNWYPFVTDGVSRMYINEKNSSNAARLFTSRDAGGSWASTGGSAADSMSNVSGIALRGDVVVGVGDSYWGDGSRILYSHDSGVTWALTAGFPGIGSWYDVAAR